MEPSVQADGSAWASVFVSAGGWVVAIVLGVITAVTQLRKTRVDESAVVLAAWKEILERHERDIAAIHERAALADKRLQETLAENDKLRARIHELEDQVDGLKRTVAQNGQSTAIQLGDPLGIAPATTAAIKRREEME